jgi:hypothetical protein
MSITYVVSTSLRVGDVERIALYAEKSRIPEGISFEMDIVRSSAFALIAVGELIIIQITSKILFF